MPYGPAAIETPGDEAQYYARLQQKSCDFDPQGTVGDAYHIYRGAARACLALQGDTAAWDAASEDLAAIRLAGGTGCLERAAYSFLKQAVLAHQRAPRARLRTRNATRASACTPAISRTRVLLTEGAATGITVEGDALWDVTKATIDGRAAQVSDKMPSYITIKPLQPLEPGSTVTIVINQGPLPPLTTRVRIPRSDSASPSPSPIPADTPSP